MSEASGRNPILQVRGVRFAYGSRAALQGVDLEVAQESITALLGPNGGGKSTLFGILSTLLPLQEGEILLHGTPIDSGAAAVRRQIGVVFQMPSVDVKLTARENLIHQGHLYGLSGGALREKVARRLAEVGLAERADEPVERFSGGMRRRLEIVKALLHRPKLLLLDEPSTGLDPRARNELWELLLKLRREEEVTILLTTHLMEEAARCDEVHLIDNGRIVAGGTPEQLCAAQGEEVLLVTGADPEQLRVRVLELAGLEGRIVGREVRVEGRELDKQIPVLVDGLGNSVESIRLGRPTLEDVFVAKTGHHLDSHPEEIES